MERERERGWNAFREHKEKKGMSLSATLVPPLLCSRESCGLDERG